MLYPLAGMFTTMNMSFKLRKDHKIVSLLVVRVTEYVGTYLHLIKLIVFIGLWKMFIKIIILFIT